MEHMASPMCCGGTGCQVVHKALFSNGNVDSLLEVHDSPQGTHGLRRTVDRLSITKNDVPEVKWFGSGMEAFRYMRQHQDEYSARGLSIVFCKSLGVDHVQDDPHKAQTDTSIGKEPSVVDNLWLEHDDNVLRTDENKRHLAHRTQGKLDVGSTTTPHSDSSVQPCTSGCSGSEDSDLAAQEAHQNTRSDAAQSVQTPVMSPGKIMKGKTDIQRVAQYFHLPINDAAKELGMCLTVLKKICRRNGLKRWPHRKLKSIDKILDSLDTSLFRDEDVANILSNDETSALCDGALLDKEAGGPLPDTNTRSARLCGIARNTYRVPELECWGQEGFL